MLAAVLKALLYAAVLVAASEGLPSPSRHLRSRFLGRRGLSARRLKRILLGAAATAASLCALVFALRLGGFDPDTLTYLTGTAPVRGWGLILIGALLGVTVTRGVWARRLSTGLMLVGLSWSGHLAAASPWGRLVVLTHLAAVSWWIASLLSLAYVLPRWRAPRLARILADFSARAAVAVGLLVLAGGMAILLLARGHPLAASYLIGLAIKLALVAAVLLLALHNKVRLTPALVDRGPARLQRALGIELVLMALILVATAALTSFLSPHQGH